MRKIKIHKPDDWHLHLRDGELLKLVLPHTVKDFGRALIMPNLIPPVITTSDAESYHREIMDALDNDIDFQPFMTLYLTEDTDPRDVEDGIAKGIVKAVKLYPAGATTNSSSGVRNFSKINETLAILSAKNVPLCVHGEFVDGKVDIFDRETEFIQRVLTPIHRDFPDLKIILEHITTQDAIDFVLNTPENIAATITVHHLVINRNDMFKGGIRPHYFCLPIAKREVHRQSLVKVATSGNPNFFLGTDSAPHTIGAKESACGCAGIFTTPVAMAILAHVFENQDALDKLEGFTSLFGAKFYGQPPNPSFLTLKKESAPIKPSASISRNGLEVSIFDPEFDLHWKVID